MNRDQFREIVTEWLLPMLGAQLEPSDEPSSSREKVVAYKEPTRIALKPQQSADFRSVIYREQGFSKDERRLTEIFVRELQQIGQVASEPFFRDLLAVLPRHVVATHLGSGTCLAEVLDQCEAWAAQTYEGQAISVSIGIDKVDGKTGVRLVDFWQEDLAPVMSNGYDTMLVCSGLGLVHELEQLTPGPSGSFSPYRLGQVASWAKGKKVGVVLNQRGEILVFSGGTLKYAKRDGSWTYYNHAPVVARMSPPQDKALRLAVYESCLDVSFARSGGCVAVFASGKAGDVVTCVSEDDLLERRQTVKSRLFSSVLGLKFQDLDRRLRQEVIALDGATVLDHYGNVLAVGAIVEVPAGSTGGGRLAAAKRLSQFGLGIKVSEDGSIRGFRHEKEVFSV